MAITMAILTSHSGTLATMLHSMYQPTYLPSCIPTYLPNYFPVMPFEILQGPFSAFFVYLKHLTVID